MSKLRAFMWLLLLLLGVAYHPLEVCFDNEFILYIFCALYFSLMFLIWWKSMDKILLNAQWSSPKTIKENIENLLLFYAMYPEQGVKEEDDVLRDLGLSSGDIIYIFEELEDLYDISLNKFSFGRYFPEEDSKENAYFESVCVSRRSPFLLVRLLYQLDVYVAEILGCNPDRQKFTVAEFILLIEKAVNK